MNKKEINQETSQIPWHELQRFFASGLAISVSPVIDLVEVAYQVSTDNKAQVEEWISDKKVQPVSDEQALKWFEQDAMVWAVVIKPWVLIQEERHESAKSQ